MQHGDLVLVPGYTRKWVALRVTKEDIKNGTCAMSPGIHLFSGFWYEKDGVGPFDHRCYGKMIRPYGKVIGRMTTVWAARAMCR